MRQCMDVLPQINEAKSAMQTKPSTVVMDISDVTVAVSLGTSLVVTVEESLYYNPKLFMQGDLPCIFLT